MPGRNKNRDLFMRVFLACPYPVSKWIYHAGRATMRKNRRQHYFADVFDTVSQMGTKGDFLEFGVYRGASFITASQQARRTGLKEMRFFAFDGFMGLPDGEAQVFTTGQFAYPEHLFRKAVRKAGVDPKRTVVVVGFFDDSLKPVVKEQTRLLRAAVVHIDCDLYTSTVPVLKFIEDLVDVGTVLMFDDWFNVSQPEEHGEAKAFLEWRLKDCFEDLYEYETPRFKKKGFIMTRRPEEMASV